jgi:hypothetical protein
MQTAPNFEICDIDTARASGQHLLEVASEFSTYIFVSPEQVNYLLVAAMAVGATIQPISTDRGSVQGRR